MKIFTKKALMKFQKRSLPFKKANSSQKIGGKRMGNSRGVTVTIAATGINSILGILYIWSIMGKQLVQEYHWTSTEAALPYTVSIVFFAVMMVISGKLQDMKGPQLSSTIGGILLGAGLILSGFVKTSSLMVITFGIMVGSGIGFCNAATTPTALKWFPLNKKGLISGIVVSGVGLAAVYISPITNSLIKSFGMAKTFIILGACALVIILFLTLILKTPSVKSAVLKCDTNSGNMTKKTILGARDIHWKEMLKTSSFYKFWFMFAFSSSAGLMIIGSIATIAVKQAKWENGFLLVVIMAVFNTLGRFLAGWISDKIGINQTMRLVFILQAINMYLFSYYFLAATLGFGTAVAGLCYGALFSVFPAAAAGEYGTKNLGLNYGIIFTSYGFGGILGPLMAGKIVDATKSFHYAYIVSAMFLVLAAIVTFTIKSSSKHRLKVSA